MMMTNNKSKISYKAIILLTNLKFKLHKMNFKLLQKIILKTNKNEPFFLL